MRVFAIAGIIATLTTPAYAQDPSKEESNRALDAKRKTEAEVDKAYKDATKRIPDRPDKKFDPWANARNAPSAPR